jgi:phosphoglycerol transferase MdoB-like AlkP superfamily enzyme
MITLSLHHPFADFPERHKTLPLGSLEGTSFGNYLHTMHFFDAALDDFTAALARSGLLDRSVVVVFGDHDAGFARSEEVAAAIRVGGDDISWTLADRVPWFVRLPVGASAPDARGERTMPAGQTDFAPTVLGLLGIDAASLPYVGRNLLGAPDDAPVVRPYGDWLDSHHLFASRGAERVCYSLAHRSAVERDECRSGDLAAQRTRDVSRRVVVEDLQERLRRSLGDRAAAVR